MGYDASLRVLIGYRLPTVATEPVVVSCEHSPPHHARFCSECGTAVRLSGGSEDIPEGAYEGFEVASYGFSEDGTQLAAGLFSPWQDINAHVSQLPTARLPTDLKAYAVELRDTLARHGVRVELADFGVFALGYESC